MFLAGLQQRLGPQSGQLVFDDLRQRDPRDHPASIGGTFPYAQVPGTKAGNVIVDPNTLQLWRYTPVGGTPVAGALRGASLPTASPTARPPQASNVLMVSGSRSSNGHPLLVGGPQIGYLYPGLTLEMDMHAPGVDVRGATSAPFPGYMLIGRGRDFAWTLTSAGADQVDQFVETLCGGDDAHYAYKGRCRAMTSFDAGVLRGGAGQADQRITFLRTVHGPVVGYANAGGRRVAISSKRASYGRDTLDQLPYQDLTLGRVRSPQDFVQSFLRSPQTFNAFYADDRHIAEVTTGLLPLRAPDVDPGLPTNGDGNHEWRGFLPAARHPQQIDPPSGLIVNWNNKAARGFEAADDAWNYGVSHRVDLLLRNLAAKRGKSSLTSMVARDERGRDAGPARDRRRAGAGGGAPRRGGAKPARGPDARAAAIVADQRWQPPGPRRRRQDRRRGRGDHGRRVAAHRRRRDGARPRPAARRARLARAALRPAAGRPGRRLALLRGQGPARPGGAAVGLAVPRALLRRRYHRDMPHGAVGGDRRGGQRARGRPGAEPVGLAGRRHEGAHHVRPRLPEDDAALHEPADRHPAGHLVQGAPRGAVSGGDGATPLERVRALCLALPECNERPSHGSPAFFVRDKRCFVMYLDDHHGDGRLALWCAAPEGMQHALVSGDPDSYFVPPYVGHRGWVGVRLDRSLEWDEIAGAIEEAWTAVAPKRLVEAFTREA